MSACLHLFKRGLCFTLLVAALTACGQGGTEVGNPNQPSSGNAPASAPDGQDAAPSFEGATPTPVPQSFLMEGPSEGVQDPEEDGALINPEES